MILIQSPVCYSRSSHYNNTIRIDIVIDPNTSKYYCMCNLYKYTDCIVEISSIGILLHAKMHTYSMYGVVVYYCMYIHTYVTIHDRPVYAFEAFFNFTKRPRWGQSQYRWRRRASVRLGIQHDRARASLGSTLTNPFWRSSLSMTWYLLGYFNVVCCSHTKWKYHLMLTHPLSCGGSNGLTQGGSWHMLRSHSRIDSCRSWYGSMFLSIVTHPP